MTADGAGRAGAAATDTGRSQAATHDSTATAVGKTTFGRMETLLLQALPAIDAIVNSVGGSVKEGAAMSSTPRRRLDRDERREEILDAALRLFAHRDAESVAMHELAEESGASPALIYHYFGDKRALAAAALERAADELVGRMRTDPDDPVAVQVVGLEVYLDYLREHPVSWSALLTAGGATDPELAGIARRVDDHAVGLSLRALAQPHPPLVLEAGATGLARAGEECLPRVAAHR